MIAVLCVTKGRDSHPQLARDSRSTLVCTQAAEDLWKNDKAAQISK